MKGTLYTTQNSRTSTSLSKSVQWHIQDKNIWSIWPLGIEKKKKEKKGEKTVLIKEE